MKSLSFKFLVLFTFLLVTSPSAQGEDLPPLDESQFSEPDPNQAPVPLPTPDQSINATSTADQNPNPLPDPGPEPYPGASVANDGTPINTATIEGVQVSSEPGDKPDEKVVTCYFIFQDKPSSYFYEVRLKEKKIIFEFNDTKKSNAQINFSTEPPITAFTVEQKQIDVNKEVRGLKAEYHNQVRVIFAVASVPKIQVNDELNVISFTYKWNSDPEKQKEYIVADPGYSVVLWSAAGFATAGVGALVYRLIYPPQKPEGPKSLPIDDLPSIP